MATTGRKPYFATNYQDMMRHIYMKPKGHSEGKKPYMEDDYFDTEYPQLKKYNGGSNSIVGGGGGGGGGIPIVPDIPVEPLPLPYQPSCLHFNSLCYCIEAERLGSQITIPYDEPVDPDCQTMICENPSDPCPPFTLPAQTATAPVTICPSTPICAASISGGTGVDNCIYVPDEGCGTKTVSVTDICGNTVSTEVRMSSGTWVETANICHSGCGSDCNSGCGTLITCYIILGGTRTYYEYCNLGGQPCGGAYGPCCASSCPCPTCVGVSLGCDPTYPTGGQFCLLLRRTITYTWGCP